ncbi:MAG: UDP-N-acetylglucosamine 2-epimerase (non-hydrolyzing) [Planctomycetota bacterium]|nr:UDP-N-acetylglucosamine 2-epimerase (non-hydrolyzing) [Planctomycetota bacterium]
MAEPGGTLDTLLIAGARPNFMKIAPLVRAFDEVGLSRRLVHTGQHYDRKMSDTFFEELGIPQPDLNLGVGSGSHVHQIAEVMRGLEAEMTANRPRVVVVVGDVNSTLAAALTANKLGIAVAHVEAGLRSFDRGMPEEINRILTDGIADWLYTTEPDANTNLAREGIAESRIRLVGNVMIDTLFHQLETARAGRPWARLGIEPQNYAVLTLHRPSNVDDPVRLESILRAIHALSLRIPVIFAIHPRTRSRIAQFGFDQRPDLTGFQAVEPLPYREALGLVDSARLVLTDSGGLQEEASVLRVPCLTLRENTERPITLETGANRLVGWDTRVILDAVDETLAGPVRVGQPPQLWDGKAALRIARHLREILP